MELLFPLLILALLVPMFLGIRRQKKEMAKTAELQDSLSVGDRVMTTAGLYGTVEALGESTVDLEIAPGVVSTWSRMVIRELVTEDADDLDDDDDVDESDNADVNGHADTPGDGAATTLEETPEQTQRRLDKE
ncbi:preprotein translocase subunit YajC [Rhodococcus sp. Q]|uniref:preprotein translocase subunit YajC n=1 Tax=Rhodococcus sp. Q TaxID=2502252 RepID=UPI0010F506A8|nr:preprotein translocase subunit YajC [Rhodococcus sp. Q]